MRCRAVMGFGSLIGLVMRFGVSAFGRPDQLRDHGAGK